MQASNDLGAALVDLFDLYHPAIPTDLGRLDVLERQVVLDIGADHFTLAAATLAKVNSTWERVKPSVLAHNGTDAAKQFDASLAGQMDALNSKDNNALTDEDKNGLEIVDLLERVY